jgi:hypothetical protein
MGSVSQLKIVESVDKESGEIVTESSVTEFHKKSEPAFIKIYIDDLSHLTGLKAIESGVLYEMIRLVDYDGVISLTKYVTKRIAVNLNCSPKTVQNKISLLLKNKYHLIRRLEGSSFELNPTYFARGKWSDIMKRRVDWKLNLNVTYNSKTKTKTIKSELNLNEEKQLTLC